jgi:RNA polymerase sigma-70 factor, ECF subfamily
MLLTVSEPEAPEVAELADECLVKLAQSDDAAAFEELARRYRAVTYRLALRIVSRPEDAEDVVQDVWLSAYTHIGRFRSESSFQTWILRIAYNRSLQMRRFQGKSALDLADGGFENEHILLMAAREGTPEDSAILNEQRATLGALLGKLAEKYRRALCLWAFDSKSIEQVSRELRISYGAAKTRLHRARLQFQKVARKSDAPGVKLFAAGSGEGSAAVPAKRKSKASSAPSRQ